MTYSKPIIIFGRSPQINDIAHLIPALQEKYTTIGINSFPIDFPNCTYWAFIDIEGIICNATKYNYKGQIILTEYTFKRLGLLNQYEKYETFIRDDFSGKMIREKILFTDDNIAVVAGKYITLTYIINWCYLMGYTDIYLAGHSLNPSWEHYDGTSNCADDGIVGEIRQFIYDASKYINIYQTDESSDMKLSFRSILSML